MSAKKPLFRLPDPWMRKVAVSTGEGRLVHCRRAKSLRWVTPPMHHRPIRICMANRTVHHQADGLTKTSSKLLVKPP